VGSLLAVLLLGNASASSQEPAEDPVATRKYSVALGFQKQQLFDEAAVRWQQFLKAYPKNKRVPNAKHHLGVCFVQQKKFTEAVKTFREILAQFPQFESNDSTQFNLALALYNTALITKKPADFQQAVAMFRELPAKYASSNLVPTALYYQAECLCLAGDLNAAVPVYKLMITGHAKHRLVPRVYQALGETLGDLDRDQEASVALREFITKFPKDPAFNEGQLRLGLSLMKQGEFSQAHGLFAKVTVVKDFPLADFALIKQAESLYGQKKEPQAAALYESLAARFPMSGYLGAAYLSAGKCRYRASQFPNAQANLTQVITRKLPEAPEAAYWLGRTLIQWNKANEALQVLDRAIAAYPTNQEFLPLIRYARIDAISRLPDRRKESVTLFAAFSAKNPDHEKASEALYLAASGALAEMDHALAQKYCESFLGNAKFSKDALVPEVLLVAAETYLRTMPAQPTKSEDCYRKFLIAAPEHQYVARAQLGIAACLYAQKKYDETVQHLTKVAGVFKDPVLVAESKLLLGRSHLEADRSEPAIVALRASLAVNAKWEHADEAVFVLAVSLQVANQFDAAIVEFNKVSATANSSYRDQALYQAGEIYRSQMKDPQAIASYAKLIAELPKSNLVPAAMYGIGIVHYENGDLKNTVTEIGKLLSAHADSDFANDAKFLRGMCHMGLKQYQPATTDLSQFVASVPDSEKRHDARFAIARCQAGLLQHDAAVATMNALLKEKPDYERADDVLYEMAFVYVAAKKEQQAVDTFRKLVKQSPDSVKAGECWYRIGEFHQKNEQDVDAISAYTTGLKVAKLPDVREKMYYKLGSAQFSTEQYPQAIATLQTLLKQYAQGELKFAATYLLGEGLYKQGTYPAALVELRKVVDSKDDAAKEFHPQALYRAGMCGANVKDWPVSQTYYSRLIAEFPNFEQLIEARYGLGVAYQNQQKIELAIPLFKAITDGYPETETAAKSWFMMGQCRFIQKKYAEAIDCFTEIAFGFKHDEWQPLGLFEAGRCYIQLKNTDAAKSMLNTLVKDFPKHARAKDAQTILKDLEK
jgi:TolA-binding protein